MNFKWTIDTIKSDYERLKTQFTESLNRIAAVKEGQETWNNTFGDLAFSQSELYKDLYLITLPAQVSGQSEVRDASNEYSQKLSAFMVEANMRIDVYKVLSRFAGQVGSRSTEETRFVYKMMTEYKKLGLGLSEDVRAQVEDIDKEISTLEIQFAQNMNEADTTMTLDIEELKGLPDDWLNAHKQEDGKIKITLKAYPDIFPIRDHCEIPTTRRKVEEATLTHLKDKNGPLMVKAVKLRDTAAQLRGYENYGEYKIEGRMASNAVAVWEFEKDLKEKLWSHGQTELAQLLELKKKDEPNSTMLHSYDFYHYHQTNLRDNYAVDQEKVKAYLPTDHVVERTLDIYQELLGLRFEMVDSVDGAVSWNEEVSIFKVLDVESSRLLGHLMLDLYPRDGKFSHACCIDIVNVHLDRNGEKVLPCAVMLANFPKKTEDKPALLPHSDVTTLFHELGHAFHMLCAEGDLYSMTGANVMWDFVEAPSQMLENWAYNSEVLKRISKHIESGDPLPDALIESISKSRKADIALLSLRQIALGVFDLTIHTPTDRSVLDRDFGELFAEIRQTYSMSDSIPGTNFPSTFGHLLSEYGAGYYGYLWSEVYALDMWSQFEEHGVMDAELGGRWREQVLSMGDTESPWVLLETFLKRKPNAEAFMKHCGAK